MKAAFFLFLFFPLFSVAQVDDKELPDRPSPPKLVNDLADVLSVGEENLLEDKLLAYNDSTSTQIVIVTVKTVGEYPISEYAIYLGEKWGVGQKGQDNGVVLLAAIDDRNMFIATGYGTEVMLNDTRTFHIIYEILVPAFQQEKYYEGFDAATNQMILYLQGEFAPGEGEEDDNFSWVEFLIILIVIIAILRFFSRLNKGGGVTYSGRGPTYWGGGGFGGFGGGGGGGGGFGGFGGGGFGGGGAGGRW